VIFTLIGVRLVSHFGSASIANLSGDIEVTGSGCLGDANCTELRCKAGRNCLAFNIAFLYYANRCDRLPFQLRWSEFQELRLLFPALSVFLLRQAIRISKFSVNSFLISVENH
jgi:hypothetical protein